MPPTDVTMIRLLDSSEATCTSRPADVTAPLIKPYATTEASRPAVAAMVRLSLTDGATGHRVLPTLYSHNYLWLLPGESQTVTLSWPARALASGHPLLTVEAYNSRPATGR